VFEVTIFTTKRFTNKFILFHFQNSFCEIKLLFLKPIRFNYILIYSLESYEDGKHRKLEVDGFCVLQKDEYF
jgi:hypothetical protein